MSDNGEVWLKIDGDNFDDEPLRTVVSGDTPARVARELFSVSSFGVGSFIEVFYDNEWKDATVIRGPRTVKVEIEIETFSSDDEIEDDRASGLTAHVYRYGSLRVQ